LNRFIQARTFAMENFYPKRKTDVAI